MCGGALPCCVSSQAGLGGLVEPSVWPAAQLGRSIMAWRELVVFSWCTQEKQDLAGLLLQGTLLRQGSCSLHSFPLPISHSFTKGCCTTSWIETDETRKVREEEISTSGSDLLKTQAAHTSNLCTSPHTSQQPTYQPHSTHKAEAHLPVAQDCGHFQAASAAIFSA